jgi:hypothetical protein
MRRDLVSVRHPRTGLGAVISDANGKRFTGAAANVLGGMRAQFGDDETVDLVLEEGWANAAGLYFGELVPG